MPDKETLRKLFGQIGDIDPTFIEVLDDEQTPEAIRGLVEFSGKRFEDLRKKSG